MKDVAQSFASKAVRNGVLGLILFAIFTYDPSSGHLQVHSGFYLLLIAGVLWLGLGFSIKNKIKAAVTISEESSSFTRIYYPVQAILTILLVLCILLSVKHIIENQMIFILPLSIYVLWMIFVYSKITTSLKAA